jgi:predicted nucleic acid-binding protein
VVGHENEYYDTAALLAGKQGMKLLDAIHYVTALQNNCQFIITNDRGFKSSETLEVIQLEDLLEAPIAR